MSFRGVSKLSSADATGRGSRAGTRQHAASDGDSGLRARCEQGDFEGLDLVRFCGVIP